MRPNICSSTPNPITLGQQANKSTGIDTRLTQLAYRLDAINSELDELQLKLDPFMLPVPPETVAQGQQDPIVQQCLVAARLESLIDVANALCYKVSELARRIDQ